MKLIVGLLGLGFLSVTVGCGDEFTALAGSSSTSGEGAATSTGSGGGDTSGSTGGGSTSSGSGGKGGSAPTYGEHECEVATHQDAPPTGEPGCKEDTFNCVSDFAGKFGSPGTTDGPKDIARFVGLFGLAAGESFVYASTAHAIRKIDIESGQVTTLAGSGMAGDADGQGSTASFSCPRGLWLHGGHLYVADSGNNSVRSIDIQDGSVTTLPDSYSDPMFLFVHPETVPLSLFVGHGGNGTQVTKYVLDGSQTLPSTGPPELTIGSRGMVSWGKYIYTADPGNHIVRKMYDDSLHQGYVGVAGEPGLANGGKGTSRLNSPSGLAIRQDPLSVYIADRGNHAIRHFVPQVYNATTIAGNGSAGHVVAVGEAAQFFDPTDVAVAGNFLFVAEGTVVRRIRLIDASEL